MAISSRQRLRGETKNMSVEVHDVGVCHWSSCLWCKSVLKKGFQIIPGTYV